MHIIKKFHIFKKEELREAAVSFSSKQFLIFGIAFVVCLVSLFIIFSNLNRMFMVKVPKNGGTITEGIIGTPTLINPVIANSDADKDLTALIYSGLMRRDSQGNLIPDLAVSLPTISENNKEYTFTLRDDAKFHNGKKLTADDVLFTIEKIKDPTIKSPQKSRWDGVSVAKIDEHTIVFTTTEPYSSFLNNTTIGIISSSLWKDVGSNEFSISSFNNTKAIGSGPFKIKKVIKDEEGFSKKYELERFNDFTLGKPLIKNFNVISFDSEKEVLKALQSKTITQAGCISPEKMSDIKKDNFSIYSTTLPRLFGLFFNAKNNKIFNDSNVLKAIDMSIDREDIINQVLNSYGASVNSPIPEKIIFNSKEYIYNNSVIEEANQLLDKNGWVLGSDGIRIKETKIKKDKKEETLTTRLSFSITTGNTAELKKAVELIKNQLLKIGIEVDTSKIYETGQLNQLIRNRDYESLFFGQIINHQTDLYSFWHSSQISDSGLNIAMYNNRKVDSILESIIKEKNDSEELNKKYLELQKEFTNNIPAIFVYSPKYLYITTKNINNVSLDDIVNPSDRFSSVYLWSANTDRVWKIFTKNNL
jgi:peptide/nickel transport system substrate-binding protein